MSIDRLSPATQTGEPADRGEKDLIVNTFGFHRFTVTKQGARGNFLRANDKPFRHFRSLKWLVSVTPTQCHLIAFQQQSVILKRGGHLTMAKMNRPQLRGVVPSAKQRTKPSMKPPVSAVGKSIDSDLENPRAYLGDRFDHDSIKRGHHPYGENLDMYDHNRNPIKGINTDDAE